MIRKRNSRRELALTLLLVLPAVYSCSAVTNDVFLVGDFGAHGDGKSDDTAAFQSALNAAGKNGGGIVYASRGTYFFAGHLDVPSAVTLKGMWESVPSHVG